MIEKYDPNKFLKENKSLLTEMANLSTKITGLSHGTIFMSNRDSSHNARVKFYRGRPGREIENAIISISKTPEIIHDPLSMTTKEKNEVFAFVKLNYTKLMTFWLRGEEFYLDEFIRKLKSI